MKYDSDITTLIYAMNEIQRQEFSTFINSKNILVNFVGMMNEAYFNE
jgi:hypothetical protein